MRPHNHSIAIKTSWSKSLGMGHIQRMTSLLWYLFKQKNINAYLISDSVPDTFPCELLSRVKSKIDFTPHIVIHDIRDSVADEIATLKKIGKVIAIDNNGDGRDIADYVIDLLPNPEAQKRDMQYDRNDIFLYGYNFIKALSGLIEEVIVKDLDFSIYPGNAATQEYTDFLISLIPEGSSYAILRHTCSYIKKGITISNLSESSYTKTILSSKTIISHFGITLYEGALSGCRLISINPTEYHSKLSDMEQVSLPLLNLGEHYKLSRKKARQEIKRFIQMPLSKSIGARDVYLKAIGNLENFSNLLFSIL